MRNHPDPSFSTRFNRLEPGTAACCSAASHIQLFISLFFYPKVTLSLRGNVKNIMLWLINLLGILGLLGLPFLSLLSYLRIIYNLFINRGLYIHYYYKTQHNVIYYSLLIFTIYSIIYLTKIHFIKIKIKSKKLK